MNAIGKITLYTTPSCPFCVAAKELLRSKKLRFREIDVSEGDDFDKLVQKTGWKTVPQIFIDGKLIGGFEELRSLNQQGRL